MGKAARKKDSGCHRGNIRLPEKSGSCNWPPEFNAEVNSLLTVILERKLTILFGSSYLGYFYVSNSIE